MSVALRAVAALTLLVACAAAGAQSVSLQGMLGRQALLIVDGAPPKGVAPGDSWHGVKVLSTSGDEAVLEIGGQRQTLHVGDAPASVGSRGANGGTRIVLTAATGGHFSAQGSINGQSARMMVDTGATFVAMGVDEAQRLGLDWRAGQQGSMNTANGVAPAWKVKLNSVRIGDVEIHDVDAVVTQQPMPQVLLGNSFLNRFQMRRDNEQMVLERRY